MISRPLHVARYWYIALAVMALGWLVPAQADIATAAPRHIGPECVPGSAPQKLSFIHVSDMHAHYGKGFSDRFPKIRRYYQSVLSENPYTLFTDAGDDYETGSLAEILSKGFTTRMATFNMGFDVRTIGNHDFAWGEAEVLRFSRDPKAIVLASNTRYLGHNPIGFGGVDYAEVQVGCIRVGFFGMVTEPFNELDLQYSGRYLPGFSHRWDWVARAKEIIAAKRSGVDIMVMLSHLGIGTDEAVVNHTPHPDDPGRSGIDLVLGGHTHWGFDYREIKGTPIIQPEFYADGLTRFDLDWDVTARKIISYSHQNIYTTELDDVDLNLKRTLAAQEARVAPNAERESGFLEFGHDRIEFTKEVTAKAGRWLLNADAALLDPNLTIMTWNRFIYPGGITQQGLLDFYMVEKQRSNTPGITSLYTAQVNGKDLKMMKEQQPEWVYDGPQEPDIDGLYTVILHKAAALHPAIFFDPGLRLQNVRPRTETWRALDQYAKQRSKACLYLDSDRSLPSCEPDTHTTVWSFDDPENPFLADQGTATLGYRDPLQTGWGSRLTKFKTTTEFRVPALRDGASGIMSYPATIPSQGYVITHEALPNGAYEKSGYLSNYTIIMDVFWRDRSAAQWRALLQTSPGNDDDADWYVQNIPGGGIGIGNYFGSIKSGKWYRIAMVVHAAPNGGIIRYYIDGQFAGQNLEAGERFAIKNNQVFLFTDNDYETRPGYINAVLFSGYAMTSSQLAELGGPSTRLAIPEAVKSLPQ